MKLIFHVDGGSRGNPGPAGYGIVVRNAMGAVVESLHASIGHQTNNVAEYSGLIAALQYAREHRVDEVLVISDSELMVRQMQGRYAVKSSHLKPLFEQAKGLARGFTSFHIEHVRREHNREADALANQAMDSSR